MSDSRQDGGELPAPNPVLNPAGIGSGIGQGRPDPLIGPGMNPVPDAGMEEDSATPPAGLSGSRAAGAPRGRLLALVGGLAVVVLLFLATALLRPRSRGRDRDRDRRPEESASRSGAGRPGPPAVAGGSVTPLMEAPHPPERETDDRLGPADIRATRLESGDAPSWPPGTRPAAARSLRDIPSFADTQQGFEDPAPYRSPEQGSPAREDALKESSLVFVRSRAQEQPPAAEEGAAAPGEPPRLDLAPGTRIEARLETEISSAVRAPVVAVVEYPCAAGGRILLPAGARVYGRLEQADRSGLVGVSFDEVELLDGARERIDAVGVGLDLGPIRGEVFGGGGGRSLLVRAASGLGSVLAEVAGNNTGGAYSEGDALRERAAENIGSAGDAAVNSLGAGGRIVVSVPAGTRIYLVIARRAAAS